jgi:hypothetical protein
MYRSAAPVCHYDDARVFAAEESFEFIQAKAQGQRRREGAAKAVETKRQQVQSYLDTLEIVVPEISADILCCRACNHYNGRSDYWYAEPDDDPLFLARITVNYLRHQLTCYEDALDAITGKVGAISAYLTIKNMVLTAIGVVYPSLENECNRQRVVLTL